MAKDAFEYVAPTPESVGAITRVRVACRELRDTLEAEIPPSRERSVAITNLEQVSMWANKGIVFNQTEPEE